MSSFKLFEIAGSGMSAESTRLNAVASNLANANTVAGRPEDVYRARAVIFEEVRSQLARDEGSAVRVSQVVQSDKAPLTRYEPGNPSANAEGYVFVPDISAVEQMVDMISASRAYKNNVEVMNTTRDLMLATLRLGQ
jgi:flagellar basal-body rod protein FlgC